MARYRKVLHIAARTAAFAMAVAGPAGVASAASAPAPASIAASSNAAAASTPASDIGLPGGHHASGTGASPDFTTLNSGNWDGFTAYGTTFTSVSAEWTAPAVSCNTKSEYAAFWVGLDGWGNDSVEQGGTTAICTKGVASYYAWWEMYPYNDIINTFAVSPGDQIKASVTYNPSTAKFTISVADLTQGRTLTKVTACHSDQAGCPRVTAEVISENVSAPKGDLPDYGQLTFSDASVTDAAGATGPLSDPAWNLYQINQITTANLTKQTTSGLSDNGTQFTATWEHV